MKKGDVKLGVRVNTHNKGLGTIIGLLHDTHGGYGGGILVELDKPGKGHNADSYVNSHYRWVKMPDKKDNRYYYYVVDYLTLLESKLIFNYLIL